jgi:DNA-binding transcriptional regulator YiaG
MEGRMAKKHRPRMTGDDLKKLREQLDLTITAAAASIAVSARSWQRWEASKKPMPEPMERLFKLTHGIKI